MQADEEGERTFACYTAPGAAFATEEELKDHYRSDWHRYNLKRKVAGLAPLPFATFEERSAREAEREAAQQKKGGTRKQAREERRVRKVEAQAGNPNSKAADFKATQDMTADQYMAYKQEKAAPFDEGSDLFSNHHEPDLHCNLAYMARTHGFYVPHLDYCVDLAGLIGYLQEKVYVGNVVLTTNKPFHTVEAVQSHMRAKGLCRMELEGHEDELGDFFDMEALAEGSPLWEVEEWEDVDGDEDMIEEGDEEAGAEAMDAEGAGAGAGAGAGGAGADGAAWLRTPGEDESDFDVLFERAVALGVLSEAALDQFTDQVASGEADEAQLIAAWRGPVRAAHRRAAAAAGGGGGAAAAAAGGGGGGARPVQADDGMSVASSSMSRVVRYSGMPSSAEAVSLALQGKEIGHRKLRRYYKQSFKPSSALVGGGALGSVHPGLQALMQQYSNAGVLSTHLMPGGGKFDPSKRNEVGRAAQHVAQKQFMKQGITNNTTMNGMKHYKNQSLNF